MEEHQTSPPIPKTPAASVPSQEYVPSPEEVSGGGKKKVTFHKLSGLSLRKGVRSGWEGASAMARAEATPEQQSTCIKPPPAKKRPTVSRNLFSDEDKLKLKERTTDIIARTVKTASEIKGRLTPAEVKAKLGNVKLKDLKARLASIDSSRKARRASSTGPVKVTARPPPAPVTAPHVLLDLDIPPCTPRKVMPTPPKKQQKASPRNLPAFERYHSLTQPVCKALPLPYKYRCNCIEKH